METHFRRLPEVLALKETRESRCLLGFGLGSFLEGDATLGINDLEKSRVVFHAC